MSEEHRRFDRIQETFTLRCRHLGSLSETWRPVVMIDISAGGLSFRGEELYQDGQQLDLEIMLPRYRTPLRLQARVLRCRPLPDAVESAAEFLDVTLDQQAEIDELVQFLRRRPWPEHPA